VGSRARIAVYDATVDVQIALPLYDASVDLRSASLAKRHSRDQNMDNHPVHPF
jgi:hypothetical protein